jgi:predicted kinase
LLLENVAQCLQCFASLGTQDELRALAEPFKAMLQPLEPLMAVRREQGRVQECHGDLHTRNVVRHHGRLLAFDCMEFEPAFRWIDVAEEIAFLLMDLRVQGAPRHAQAFLSGFLTQGGDYAACRLLRVYAIHRALVRAKVAALEAAATSDAATRVAATAKHRDYLEEIRRLLARQRPMLLLMSGLSGSGKTWLACQLAPLLGAVHLRSDVERKRLAGMAEQQKSGADIGQGIYSRAANERVVEHLLGCADDVLDGGFAVIVDATFGRRSDRGRFRQLAARHGVELRLIHCHAPGAVLESRIRGRQQAGLDASEADLAVLAWQQAHREAITVDEEMKVIDIDTTEGDLVSKIREKLSHSAAE